MHAGCRDRCADRCARPATPGSACGVWTGANRIGLQQRQRRFRDCILDVARDAEPLQRDDFPNATDARARRRFTAVRSGAGGNRGSGLQLVVPGDQRSLGERERRRHSGGSRSAVGEAIKLDYHPRVLPAIVHNRQIPLAAVRDAATHVYAAAVRTPLIRVEGYDLYLKLEVLQPIGSFKIRGAYNAIRQLPPEQLKDGVWTVSAGNAAQGVAFAARKAGVRCSVMVMDTAPETKIKAIERLGASIVRCSYDECWRTVESHASD